MIYFKLQELAKSHMVLLDAVFLKARKRHRCLHRQFCGVFSGSSWPYQRQGRRTSFSCRHHWKWRQEKTWIPEEKILIGSETSTHNYSCDTFELGSRRDMALVDRVFSWSGTSTHD